MKQLIFLALLAASGCRDKQPPVPTAEQSDQLNQAEDMLNGMAENRTGQNQEGPEANAPDPSNSSE